jgi:HSP20 family molecular chaperone IbpA
MKSRQKGAQTMATQQELTPKEKQEVQSESQLKPGRAYIPDVDIREDDNNLWLYADMPGVSQDKVSVELHDDVLTIEGDVVLDDYEGMNPLYTEYNVGRFVRRFSLPGNSRFDCDKVAARMSNGVLTLQVPKAEKAQPRRIEIKA